MPRPTVYRNTQPPKPEKAEEKPKRSKKKDDE